MGLRYPGGYVTATFNPLAYTTSAANLLVVAGGGGGASGGGGAGGFQITSFGYVIGTT
jgi:hypothetical protein